MGGPFKCEVCDVAFTRKQHVGRHMRSHTGDKPYPCKFCPDRFARSDLLSRHVNKAHGGPGGTGNGASGTTKSLTAAAAAKKKMGVSGRTGGVQKDGQQRQQQQQRQQSPPRAEVGGFGERNSQDDDWEDMPYDDGMTSINRLPYNMAPRPASLAPSAPGTIDPYMAQLNFPRTTGGNITAGYRPQQQHQMTATNDVQQQSRPQTAQALGSHSSSSRLDLQQPSMDNQHLLLQQQQSNHMTYDWLSNMLPAAASASQSQNDDNTSSSASAAAARQLATSMGMSGSQQPFANDNGMNVFAAAAAPNMAPSQSGQQQYNYTTSPQDPYAMQPSLSSDGTLSEVSPSRGQTFAAPSHIPDGGSLPHQQQQQQLFAFQPASGNYETLTTAPSVPAHLQSDGGWTSMRNVPDPVKKKRKTRACDRCNHSKTRCDSGLPCARCHSRRLPCHYSGTRAANSQSEQGTSQDQSMHGIHVEGGSNQQYGNVMSSPDGAIPEWSKSMINLDMTSPISAHSQTSGTDVNAAPAPASTSIAPTRINSVSRSTPTLAFTDSSPETIDNSASLAVSSGSGMGRRSSDSFEQVVTPWQQVGMIDGVTAYVPDAHLGTGFGDSSQDVLGMSTAYPTARSDISKTATPTTGPSRPSTAFNQPDPQTSTDVQDATLADWQRRIAQISLQDPLAFASNLDHSMQLPQVVLSSESSHPGPDKPATFDDRPVITRQRSSSLPSIIQQGIPSQGSGLGTQMAQNLQSGWQQTLASGHGQEAVSNVSNHRRFSLSRPAASVLQNVTIDSKLPIQASWQRAGGPLQTLAPERPPSFLLTPSEQRGKVTSALARPGNKRLASQTLGPDEIKRQTVGGADEAIQVEPEWRAYQNGPLSSRRNSLPVFGTPSIYMDNTSGSFPFGEETQGFPFPSAAGNLMGYDAGGAVWASKSGLTSQVNFA